jgi:CRP/FNR family cyclic AMP-dependent transcriptional regulator
LARCTDSDIFPHGAATCGMNGMTTDGSWAHALDMLSIKQDDTRQALQQAAEVRQFPARSTIIAQDDTDDSVSILLTGRARVVLLSEEGQEIWLDSLAPGAVIGELAALTGQHRSSGIIAESDVLAASYPAEQFFDLVRSHGELGLSLAHLLARRVHHTTQRMFELSALSAPGRVYAELLRMGVTTDEGIGPEIRPIPSLTAIARRVNSTRETVSRTVSDLEKRGLLERLDDGLKLVDPEQLDRLRSAN